MLARTPHVCHVVAYLCASLPSKVILKDTWHSLSESNKCIAFTRQVRQPIVDCHDPADAPIGNSNWVLGNAIQDPKTTPS